MAFARQGDRVLRQGDGIAIPRVVDLIPQFVPRRAEIHIDHDIAPGHGEGHAALNLHAALFIGAVVHPVAQPVQLIARVGRGGEGDLRARRDGQALHCGQVCHFVAHLHGHRPVGKQIRLKSVRHRAGQRRVPVGHGEFIVGVPFIPGGRNLCVVHLEALQRRAVGIDAHLVARVGGGGLDQIRVVFVLPEHQVDTRPVAQLIDDLMLPVQVVFGPDTHPAIRHGEGILAVGVGGQGRDDLLARFLVIGDIIHGIQRDVAGLFHGQCDGRARLAVVRLGGDLEDHFLAVVDRYARIHRPTRLHHVDENIHLRFRHGEGRRARAVFPVGNSPEKVVGIFPANIDAFDAVLTAVHWRGSDGNLSARRDLQGHIIILAVDGRDRLAVHREGLGDVRVLRDRYSVHPHERGAHGHVARGHGELVVLHSHVGFALLHGQGVQRVARRRFDGQCDGFVLGGGLLIRRDRAAGDVPVDGNGVKLLPFRPKGDVSGYGHFKIERSVRQALAEHLIPAEEAEALLRRVAGAANAVSVVNVILRKRSFVVRVELDCADAAPIQYSPGRNISCGHGKGIGISTLAIGVFLFFCTIEGIEGGDRRREGVLDLVALI